MIHIEYEFFAHQVLIKFMESIHHHECLPFNCGMISFNVVEQLQCTCNWLVAFSSKVLCLHNPNYQIKSICVNMKLNVPMWWNQDQCIHVLMFDFFQACWHSTTHSKSFVSHNNLLMGAIMKAKSLMKQL
jgi:hypothetical protein